MKNITQDKKTGGYDNKLTHTEHDLLDRESLANNILNTIVDTPTDWSINTGIYGPWGTGKTTLLNFIEIAAKKKGYLYISFNPTSYTDSNGMWAAFYSILLKELEKNGVDISNALPGSQWKGCMPEYIKKKISSCVWIQKATSYLFQASDIANSVNKSISNNTVNSALTLVSRYLRAGSIFFDNLKEQLNGKKIIIAIDDIDRANPTLIHQLFLSLREILDLPCFAFILSMDRDRVAKAISLTHPSYGSGHEFLEKIIDFPYFLPEPTQEQVELIFSDQLKEIVGISNNIDCAPLLQYLPKNPRKIKLVSRNIKILKNEILRHGEDEINWLIIVFLCILRSKSQHAYDISIKELKDNDLYDIAFIEDKNKKKEKMNEKIDFLIKDCTDIDNAKTELMPLFEFLFDHYYEFRGQNFSYYANLITEPHYLTWKEFKSLLSASKSKNANDVINSWIIDTENKRGKKYRQDIVGELFESATNYYSSCLEKAANTILLDAFNSTMSDATTTLQFIESLFNAVPEYGTKELFIICDKILAWRHFQKNDADINIRAHEQQILSSLIQKLETDSFIDVFYELAKRRQSLSSTPFGPENDRPKLDFVDTLINLVYTYALEGLASKFEQEGEVRLAKKSYGNTALGYLLLNRDSILFKADNITYLDRIIQQANSNTNIYNNLHDYFDIFCEYSNQQNLSKEIICIVAPKLWIAIISRQLQFRSHSGLLKQRQILIDLGVKEEHLLKPQWLEES
jgi:hypothetical protein